MKKWYILWLLLLFVLQALPQQKIISWHFSSKKILPGLYEVRLEALLEKGWHIYAAHPGEGPVPTSVTFTKSPGIELKGSIKETGILVSENSEIFNSKIHYYEHRLILTQRVLVRNNLATSANGRIEYMLCNREQCFPPKTVEFSIGLQ